MYYSIYLNFYGFAFWNSSLIWALSHQAVPFYGFSSSYKLFVKLYLYEPAKVRRVCNLLGSGAIHNRSSQSFCFRCFKKKYSISLGTSNVLLRFFFKKK